MKITEIKPKLSFVFGAGGEGSPHKCSLIIGDKEIGYVSWCTDFDWKIAYVHKSFVDYDYRNKGYGKILYKESFKKLKKEYEFARASTNITSNALNIWKSLEKEEIAYKICQKNAETYCVNLKSKKKKAPEDWFLS